MHFERIDFISSYCDRWCERCSFTTRCAVYACKQAIDMCGDVVQGLELAIGMAHPGKAGSGTEPHQPAAAWLEELATADLTPEERARQDEDERARDERLDASSLATAGEIYCLSSVEWLEEHVESLREASDPVLGEALQVVMHDAFFIAAKIHRALDGRDRFEHGKDFDEDPVQNDWNGSAKVALISAERSEPAWRVIAAATGDAVATALGDLIADIRRQLLDEFPQARKFVRPGFDEPWR